MLFQITPICLNEHGYVTLYSVMNLMVENVARITENGAIMAENITILTDKNVNKQNFTTRQFHLNLNRTSEEINSSFHLFEIYVKCSLASA